MFPYTEKYTESESDIKNTNLFYKIGQQYQNAFDLLEHFGEKMEKKKENKETSFFYFVLCTSSIIHSLYFCKFGDLYIFSFFIYFVYLYLFIFYIFYIFIYCIIYIIGFITGPRHVFMPHSRHGNVAMERGAPLVHAPASASKVIQGWLTGRWKSSELYSWTVD